MTSALRWAAMRAILMFHNCEGQSHKTVSTDHNFCRERTAEADSNRGQPAKRLTTRPNRVAWFVAVSDRLMSYIATSRAMLSGMLALVCA